MSKKKKQKEGITADAIRNTMSYAHSYYFPKKVKRSKPPIDTPEGIKSAIEQYIAAKEGKQP